MKKFKLSCEISQITNDTIDKYLIRPFNKREHIQAALDFFVAQDTRIRTAALIQARKKLFDEDLDSALDSALES